MWVRVQAQCDNTAIFEKVGYGCSKTRLLINYYIYFLYISKHFFYIYNGKHISIIKLSNQHIFYLLKKKSTYWNEIFWYRTILMYQFDIYILTNVGYISTIYFCDKVKGKIHKSKNKQ